MKGSEFVATVKNVRGPQLSRMALQAMFDEETPNFLDDRRECFTEAIIDGGYYRCDYEVMPNYLAIGTDDDFVTWPLSIVDLQEYCDHAPIAWTGAGGGTVNEWFIPPKKIVFTTWVFSDCKIVPQAFGAMATMTWPETILAEQERINGAMERNGCLLRAFVRAKKAYITAPNVKMEGGPNGNGTLHFTGWYSFDPIIPEERTVGTLDGKLVYAVQAGDEIGGKIGHEPEYFDYSHGCDLVYHEVLINGERFTFDEVCSHPKLCVLVSDQGPFNPRYPNVGTSVSPARKTSRMPAAAQVPAGAKPPVFVTKGGVAMLVTPGTIGPHVAMDVPPSQTAPIALAPTGMSGSTKLAIVLAAGITGYAAWYFYKTRAR